MGYTGSRQGTHGQLVVLRAFLSGARGLLVEGSAKKETSLCPGTVTQPLLFPARHSDLPLRPAFLHHSHVGSGPPPAYGNEGDRSNRPGETCGAVFDLLQPLPSRIPGLPAQSSSRSNPDL